MKSKHIKSYSEKIEIPHQATIIVDSLEEERDKLIRKHNELIAINKLYTKASVIKDKENSSRDREIENLNEKIRKLASMNFDTNIAVKKEDEKRHRLMEEQKQICDYCNDIRIKFKDPQRTIRELKEQIEYEKQRKGIDVEDSEEKLKKLNEDIKRAEFKLSEAKNLSNRQQGTIVGEENKIRDIKAEIEQQRKTFSERAAINKIKFDELEKKYANLEKKIYALQMNADIRKSEKLEKANKIFYEQNKKEEMEKQLEEYNKENKEIEEQINEITRQLNYKSIGSLVSNSSELLKKGTIKESMSASTHISLMNK